MNDIAISVSNVSKCYQVFDDQRSRLLHAVWPAQTKGMQEVWALKDINFEIKRGEAVAIIGRNGGGKSTLLEILTGTLTPTTGSVKVNGRVSALLELGSGFNPEYSGRDNIILNGLLLGLSKDDILSRFGEIEAFAEIGAAIDRPVKTYSSGMMMRLAFSVQVLCDPDILIIDEALSVGDFFFQQKCLRFIRNLCAKGATLLFVSHDMGTVREICQRGIFLSKGKIAFDGDNLQSIRHYLKEDMVSSQTNSLKAANSGQEYLAIPELKLEHPFWLRTLNVPEQGNEKQAYIMAVGVNDENNHPATSARMGSKVRIKVHYRAFEKAQLHVHIVIKNKYDQIVSAVGSYNLGAEPPILVNGKDAIFELSVQLSLEAGDYTFSASLTQPSVSGMTGVLIDETPWLGPFQICWDYSSEVPPFFGLVGLNCSGDFVQ